MSTNCKKKEKQKYEPTLKEIKDCMKHDGYKRTRGGSIKQIKR